MAWWWFGNAVLLLVVIPVVILQANRVLRPAIEIRKYGDDILEHGALLSRTLDAVPALVETRDQVKKAREGVTRYGRALEQVL